MNTYHPPSVRSRPRSTSRGTASIEAILVLMTLVIVWAGVTHMGHLLERRLVARSEARSCAWAVSLSACQVVPPECEMKEEDTEPPEKTNELENSKDEMDNGEEELEPVHEALNSEVDGFFKKRVTISSSREVQGSAILQIQNEEMKTRYSLPCNTKPHTLGDMISDILEKFRGKEDEEEDKE